ncbi:MAG: YihY/virulence factor BrkB family protein [Rhodobacteraceae bacterium]|nr:YihY/virulence factor BrkB family protein [Paracoccaceae bacterium]
MIAGRIVPAARTLGAINATMGARRIDLVAAGVAFYALFALFPALAALVSIAGYFYDPEMVEAAFADYSDLLPPDAVDLIAAQLEQIRRATDTTLGWASLLSLAIALWSARLGVAGLARGLTAVYGLPPRSGIMFYAHALALTVAMVSVGAVALGLLVVLPLVLALVPAGFLDGAVTEALRWLVALAVVLAGLALFYRYGPNRARAERNRMVLWPGLAVAVVLWLAASAVLNFYLANFADYNEIYGSIGAVVVLMLWFYVSAYAILLGGVTNAVLEERIAGRDGAGSDAPLA